MDLDKVLQKVDEVLPPQPALGFTIRRENAGLFDSKIGGIPYFPKNMEYPKGKHGAFEGKPLVLLARLNFGELPHIPDFPEKGILQFFIAPDDLYGMSSEYGEGMARQENFRVIYHETILTDETQLLSAEEIPDHSGEQEGYLPFSGEYRLTPCQPGILHATSYDHRFHETFVSCYNTLSDEEIEEIWDVVDDEEYDALTERDEGFDAWIGGYPVFTQDDPRYEERISDCDVLLFELDSASDPENDVDIMWGDSGTGAFFIPRDNLKKLDFSRVLYNYDCC